MTARATLVTLAKDSGPSTIIPHSSSLVNVRSAAVPTSIQVATLIGNTSRSSVSLFLSTCLPHVTEDIAEGCSPRKRALAFDQLAGIGDWIHDTTGPLF
jgi:hypothetical protein